MFLKFLFLFGIYWIVFLFGNKRHKLVPLSFRLVAHTFEERVSYIQPLLKKTDVYNEWEGHC